MDSKYMSLTHSISERFDKAIKTAAATDKMTPEELERIHDSLSAGYHTGNGTGLDTLFACLTSALQAVNFRE